MSDLLYFLLGGIAWLIVGAWSFLYWFLDEEEFTVEDIGFLILWSFLGFLGMFLAYQFKHGDKVLLKSKKKI